MGYQCCPSLISLHQLSQCPFDSGDRKDNADSMVARYSDTVCALMSEPGGRAVQYTGSQRDTTRYNRCDVTGWGGCKRHVTRNSGPVGGGAGTQTCVHPKQSEKFWFLQALVSTTAGIMSMGEEGNQMDHKGNRPSPAWTTQPIVNEPNTRNTSSSIEGIQREEGFGP